MYWKSSIYNLIILKYYKKIQNIKLYILTIKFKYCYILKHIVYKKVYSISKYQILEL